MVIEIEDLKEYAVIKEALMSAPYEKVFRLIPKLDQQIAAQLQQPTPAIKKNEE